MSAPFSVTGYVKSYKTYQVGDYQKAYVQVSSMRLRTDKEGKKIYDNLCIQCFVNGTPSFEEGSYIIASGEIQTVKGNDGNPQTVLFADSVGIDPLKYREPNKNGYGNNGGAQKPNNGYARQNNQPQQSTQNAPRQNAGYNKRQQSPQQPSDADYQDDRIPF